MARSRRLKQVFPGRVDWSCVTSLNRTTGESQSDTEQGSNESKREARDWASRPQLVAGELLVESGLGSG